VVFPRSFDDGVSERAVHGRAPAGATTTTNSSDLLVGAPPTPARVPGRTTSGFSSTEGQQVVMAPAVHTYAPSPRLSLDRRQRSIDRANSGFSSRDFSGGIHDSMPVISPSAFASARRSRGGGAGFELHSASDLSDAVRSGMLMSSGGHMAHPGVPLPSDLEEGVVPFAHGWVPLQKGEGGRTLPADPGPGSAEGGAGASKGRSSSGPLFSGNSPTHSGNPGPVQSQRQRLFEAALRDEQEVAEHLVRASVKAEAAADKMLAEAAKPVLVPGPVPSGKATSSVAPPPGGLLMSIADGEQGQGQAGGWLQALTPSLSATLC
jgi:hypothetical protein